jgi:hypothetical protein
MTSIRLMYRRAAWVSLIAALSAIVTSRAEAHVKWFCGAVDVTAPPLGLLDVLSPTLLVVGIGSLSLVAAGSLVDSVIERRWPGALLWRSQHPEIVEELLVRIGMALFLVMLWFNAGVAPWGTPRDRAILTPELLDNASWLGWLQLATAAMLLFRPIIPIAALGLLTVYGVGIARYGLFHMIDYAFFAGLAAYLALSGPYFDRRPELQRWRVSILAGTVAFSLMWTGIEKLLYPQWTAIVLTAHPIVTMGFPASFVTVAAAFVEISVAFYLLVGRTLLRVDAAIVILVLLAAVPEFGLLDTVGHLPLVMALLVVVLHGPTPLQQIPYPRRTEPVIAAAWTGGLYALSFAVIMAMYYALQRAAVWA